MTETYQNGNGSAATAEVSDGEEDGPHEPLTEERAAEAAALAGPAATGAYDAQDPHVEFVMRQYGDMDHMGGA